jgi:hypothetical protein
MTSGRQSEWFWKCLLCGKLNSQKEELCRLCGTDRGTDPSEETAPLRQPVRTPGQAWVGWVLGFVVLAIGFEMIRHRPGLAILMGVGLIPLMLVAVRGHFFGRGTVLELFGTIMIGFILMVVAIPAALFFVCAVGGVPHFKG